MMKKIKTAVFISGEVLTLSQFIEIVKKGFSI